MNWGPEQDSGNEIVICIALNENTWILIQNSQDIVPKEPVDPDFNQLKNCRYQIRQNTRWQRDQPTLHPNQI